MILNYLDVCTGLSAATQAWHGLGWKPWAFSEIEPFPCAVLAHHYPNVPNLGDMTKFQEWPDAAIDLLVGGTPCQSFSVAGLRKGLADPRGNLMLTYGAIAAKYRPTWLVWENVPGVLSSNGGKDFGTFLGMLAELGYGFAYRVLDAQYFGVAQRRRRVFVVGYLGDWRRAAAVLFERHSLSGHPAPSREAGEDFAGAITRGAFSGGAGGRPEGAAVNHFIPHGFEAGPAGVSFTDLAPTLDARCKDGPIRNQLGLAVATLDASYGRLQGCSGQDANHGHSHLVAQVYGGNNTSRRLDVSPALTCNRGQLSGDFEAGALVIPINDMATRHGGTDGSGNHAGKGHGLGIGHNADPMFTLTKGDKHAVAYRTAGDGAVYEEGDATAPLTTGTDKSANIVAAFKGGQGSAAGGIGYDEQLAPTLSAADSGSNRTPTLMQGMQVRRLTPRECERLQGFPDDYTLIPVRNKPAADGPRYKALGNSMAVPVMACIGGRIDQVNQLIAQQEAA